MKKREGRDYARFKRGGTMDSHARNFGLKQQSDGLGAAKKDAMGGGKRTEEEMSAIRKPTFWDERDYRLWSEIQCLPSYGLIPGPGNDRMVSLNAVVDEMKNQAEKRFRSAHGGEK